MSTYLITKASGQPPSSPVPAVPRVEQLPLTTAAPWASRGRRVPLLLPRRSRWGWSE